ncbi:lipopolysaccharide biosynthesis protein [Sphingopyxis yananensis]|uniref:lipopolysaccharide biosynthesis protein n=1 Tax=Sphingopyxis yananensis TaxID=2886687 RepID=UPI001D11B33B|nr:oligosaccharide flippase family protein [Sphingopyxis yananensis]MCC2601743.1 oligosaccharide flippase family protein [Sphingopyxis yananensis]
MSSDPALQPITSRHVAKGLGTTLLARTGAVVEIVAQPLYVVMFGLTGFGFYAVLWAAINILQNIFDMGMTNALQRTVPQSASRIEAVAALRTAILCGVTPCLMASVAIYIYADQLAHIFNVAAEHQSILVPSIRIFVWALPLWAFIEIMTAAMRAQMVFGAEIRLRIIWEQILRLVFAAILYAAGYGLTGLLYAHLLSLSVTALLSIRLTARYYDLADIFRAPWGSDISRNSVQAGLSVLPTNIISRIFTDAPMLILNFALPGASGAMAAGLFTISRKLSSVVQLVRTAFSYVMAPLASSAEKRDRAQVTEIYAYATRFIVAVALPLSLVLAAGSGPLLSLFGPDAQMAKAALIILLMARAIEAMMGISSPVLQVIAAYRHQLTASIIGILSAIGAGFLATPYMPPLTAVTLAMAVGLIISAAIPMIQLAWIERLHPFDHRFPSVLWRTLGLSAICCGAATLFSQLPDFLSIPLIVISAVASIWASLRFALPIEDRASLGKLGRTLRLIP